MIWSLCCNLGQRFSFGKILCIVEDLIIMADSINSDGFKQDLVNVRDCKEELKRRTGLDITGAEIEQISKEVGVSVFNIGRFYFAFF